jgi:hypothetical protein
MKKVYLCVELSSWIDESRFEEYKEFIHNYGNSGVDVTALIRFDGKAHVFHPMSQLDFVEEVSDMQLLNPQKPDLDKALNYTLSVIEEDIKDSESPLDVEVIYMVTGLHGYNRDLNNIKQTTQMSLEHVKRWNRASNINITLICVPHNRTDPHDALAVFENINALSQVLQAKVIWEIAKGALPFLMDSIFEGVTGMTGESFLPDMPIYESQDF